MRITKFVFFIGLLAVFISVVMAIDVAVDSELVDFRGYLTELDGERIYLADTDGAEYIYFIKDDVRVTTVDGDRIELRDIPAGGAVDVYFSYGLPVLSKEKPREVRKIVYYEGAKWQ